MNGGKFKIAQIGTFDVENFGDLLFPTILEHRYRHSEIDLFSPIGNRKKPFENEKYVYSIEHLDEKCRSRKYDLMVIGGGDIIRMDKNVAGIYDNSFQPAAAMWQFPILTAYRYHIPVIFNCPGVPFPFRKHEKRLVKLLLSSVDYISVRDSGSRRRLQQCGLENIQVVPDTVCMIPDYYQMEEMKEIQAGLVQRKILPDWEKYLVFQHNTCSEEDMDVIKDSLKKLSDEYHYPVLLMPIGYVHDDMRFMKQLAFGQEAGLFYCREKLPPKQMCAVLACSSGYIGTSLHGAVVSFAYGRPIVMINTAGMTKVSGFLECIGRKEAEVRRIEGLLAIALQQLENLSKDGGYKKIRQRIKAHFTFIEAHFLNNKKPKAEKQERKKKNQKENFSGETKEKNLLLELLVEYHKGMEHSRDDACQMLEEARIYYDYGRGFSEIDSEAVRYKKMEGYYELSARLKENRMGVRLDLIEDKVLYVENLKIMIDGRKTAYSIPYSCRYKDGIILNSLDSMILLENTDGTELKLTFKGWIIEDESLCRMIAYGNQRIGEEEKKSAEFMHLNQELRKQNQVLMRDKADLENQCLELKKQLQNAIEQEKAGQKEIEKLNQQLDDTSRSLQQQCAQTRQQCAVLEQQIKDIYRSTSWKVSRPVRAAGSFIRRTGAVYGIIHKCGTAAKIFHHGGVKLLVHEIKHYKGYKQQLAAQEHAFSDCGIDSEYQENMDFTNRVTDIKMLAFYLPQFHVFPENDAWWGKGFTEWDNVRSAQAQFAGHYQPRVPHADFGYYDLSDINILKKQAGLAKQHGIYGFCFYYYWFSGKRLMEKPVDMLLEHPEIALPFCLCWANENWTRAWDGQSRSVLIAQEYSKADDKRFMSDLKKYIDDERYIKIDGKPLIVVYNPGQIPDCHKSFAAWRKTALETGIGEILIWTCRTANHTAESLKIEDCIDAEAEFPPHNMWSDTAAVRNVDLKGKSAYLYSYPKIVKEALEKMEHSSGNKVPIHRSCMLAWDNAARRKNGWFTYCGFSLKSLYQWVLAAAEKTREDFKPSERFMFVNAWNEWGEGTYLEPDEAYGYAGINTISKALMGVPFKNDLKIINRDMQALEYDEFQNKSGDARIAVQIHMFYLDTLEETVSYLNRIPYPYDCFVSTDTKQKQQKIEAVMKQKLHCRNLSVQIYENRGRDAAPFLMQMKGCISSYDYICHIHSKKTKTEAHGDDWRKYIYEHLFGNSAYLKRVFHLFETEPEIGILMPETYPVLELQAEWGGNKEGTASLLRKLGVCTELPKEPVFPVGNMFWARTAAVKKLFAHGPGREDFPPEAGQVNATAAHQIERAWVYAAAGEGYSYRKIFNNCRMREKKPEKKKRLLSYVHYDKENRISDDDLRTLEVFSALCSEVLFVTNSPLGTEELDKVSGLAGRILVRENKGFDFGAWKDSLFDFGRENAESFDELILMNNSCFPPVFDINEMFAEMEKKQLDFWGNTVCPFSPDGSYIGEACIQEHLQSYFIVFGPRVVQSSAFWDFWKNLPECREFIDVIAKCETKLTKILSEAGFSYEPYIRETYYISRFLNNYAVLYEKPCALLLLKDAFVKKKCYQYMDAEEKVRLEYLLEHLRTAGEALER